MIRFLLFSTLFISHTSLFSQSNLVFFSEDGQRFHVIINGEVKNTSPLTKVKVENLVATNQKVKIKFDEDSLGEINRNLPLEAYKEYTFKVKRKSEGGVGSAFRKIGRKIERDVKTGSINHPSDVDGDPNNKYALRFVSESDLSRPVTDTPVQSNVGATQQGASSNTTVTQTTTTTSSTANPQGESVSVNMSVTGVNANVQMNSTETYQEETTVVTTTTTTNESDHYVMEGYSGAVGCPWPMNDADFSNARNSITTKDFEDSKLTVSKQVASSNCLFASQVKDIMKLFDFEDTKLDFAKFAYAHTYDLNNYYQVNDAFEFESSIDELNKFISIR